MKLASHLGAPTRTRTRARGHRAHGGRHRAPLDRATHARPKQTYRICVGVIAISVLAAAAQILASPDHVDGPPCDPAGGVRAGVPVVGIRRLVDPAAASLRDLAACGPPRACALQRRMVEHSLPARGVRGRQRELPSEPRGWDSWSISLEERVWLGFGAWTSGALGRRTGPPRHGRCGWTSSLPTSWL